MLEARCEFMGSLFPANHQCTYPNSPNNIAMQIHCFQECRFKTSGLYIVFFIYSTFGVLPLYHYLKKPMNLLNSHAEVGRLQSNKYKKHIPCDVNDPPGALEFCILFG